MRGPVTVHSSPARVGKLREVLDYWSCSSCLSHATPEQDYFCAVCRCLQREVEVLPRGRTPSAARAPVVGPEAWRRTEEAARREGDQAAEIALLEARQSELETRMARLLAELESLRLRRNGKFVELLLVGVRRGDVEFLEEWESEAPAAPPRPTLPLVETRPAAPVPPPAPPPEQASPPAAIPPEPPEEERSLAVAPVISRRAQEAERSLDELEAEIRHVEADLAVLANEERTLTTRGVPESGRPFVTADYTLYVRETTGRGGRRHLRYFFSQEPTLGAVPVPLPEGYRVVKDPKTDVPSLRRIEPGFRPKIPLIPTR